MLTALQEQLGLKIASPKEVGSTVTWMNKDSRAHSVVADGGVFNSGTIAPDGQFSFMFQVAGTFTYHDTSNASISGTVNVNPSSSY